MATLTTEHTYWRWIVRTVGILLAFEGAIAGGLLEPLTWPLVLAAVLIVFVVRPVSGIIGLIGYDRAPWPERRLLRRSVQIMHERVSFVSDSRKQCTTGAFPQVGGIGDFKFCSR